jgi:DNA-binding SARP family transcriptional activator/tetratricopeptide (TPR) repeat protein
MSPLRVHLFGGLTLIWNRQPLPPISGSAARSLFAYLVTYRERAPTRDLLAGTFWPDLPEAVARRRLSQTLWQIRRTLDPHPALLAEGDTVRLNPELPLWLDVDEFSQLCARCTGQEPEALADCASCVDLYRGEFLAGYYDDWLVPERERLREILVTALGRLVEGYKGQLDYDRALVYARRLAAEDPWREETHREVMRLCHLLGLDAEALRQFDLCRRALAEELGVEPSSETITLAKEIAYRSGLPEPPHLPTAARPALAPMLERPDKLPLVGRRRELAELLRQVEAAVAASGGLTLVYGEAGVGKSRLLRELAANAQWRGVRTAWGQCYELATPPAYQPLVEALRTAMPELVESGLEPLWRAELSRLLPELSTDGGLPPTLSPEEERRRLLEGIARAFLNLAQVAPHVVLLEDVHWMDPASLEALRYLLPRLANERLLFVLTARPEELAEKDSVREKTSEPAAAVASMESTRLPRRLELQRFDVDETEEFIQRVLDLEQPVPRFSARLYAETEGNPFFLIEMLWALVEGGLLYRDEAGEWTTPWDVDTEGYAELPLPLGVAQSIARRLDGLPAPLSELLRLAAVIGRGVSFQLWLAASGRDQEGLLTIADELRARGLLLAGRPASGADGDPGSDFYFAHDQIRRVTYDGLAPPRRRLYHHRVAQALVQIGANDGSRVAELAYHWMQAEVWDRAAQAHREAGDRARRLYANVEAAAHYTDALVALERLSGPADEHRRFQLHLAREAVYESLGDREAQAKDLQALELLADALEDDRRMAEVALRQANYADLTSDYISAATAAQRAVHLAQSVQDVGSEASGYLQWGRALWRQGDYDGASPKLERALDQARTTGLREVEAESLINLGEIPFLRGDFAEARSYFHRALGFYRDIGDLDGQTDALRRLGRVCGVQGDLIGARTHFEQALHILKQTGERQGESLVLLFLGNVAMEEGDYASADTRYEKALHISREIDNPGLESHLLGALGTLADRQNRYATARMYHEQALSISRKTGDRRAEGVSLTELAIDAYNQRDFDAAAAFAEQARRIAREVGDRRYEGWSLWVLGRITQQEGGYADAGAFFEEALQVSREIGDLALEHAVLCNMSLLFHDCGEYTAAHERSQEALRIAEESGSPDQMAAAMDSLGHALAGLEYSSEAADAYKEAIDLQREAEQHNMAMVPLAGLARVYHAQGRLSQAQAAVEQILQHLNTGNLDGTDEPFRIYLTCYRVLRALRDARAPDLLITAHRALQEQAAAISDAAARSSFLEGVATHREILTAFEQERTLFAHDERTIVSLPRADAPLGRPLRADEYVSVTWTLNTPDDERIRGKIARRRQRLLRLLHEAQRQGAAPRDTDLADALDVSLSTLRRDMAVLRAEGHDLPTRWRRLTT